MSEVLNENELNDVNGGYLHNYPASAGFKVEIDGNEYDVVDSSWGCPCHDLGHEPDSDNLFGAFICMECKSFKYLFDKDIDNINGWDGYCTWEK